MIYDGFVRYLAMRVSSGMIRPLSICMITARQTYVESILEDGRGCMNDGLP